MRVPTVVVMGVSGVGKTTVARLLAERLTVPFAEGDDFHPPANVARMAAGTPLDDADRGPWLAAVSSWLGARDAAGTGGVITCSALKRRYRDVLREGAPDAFFAHLSGASAVVGERLEQRAGHFMPPGLLGSQYAALEPLAPDEQGAVYDVGPLPEQLVESVLADLRAR